MLNNVLTIFFICTGIIFSTHFSSSASFAETPNCSIASTAMQTASMLRGLRVMHNVPCKLLNRKQVEQYLRDKIAETIPAEKVKNEGLAFKALGIIPTNFDYLNGLVNLYVSQLGGYYDPQQNYYAMASWMPNAMQMTIAVHELTHALQDQHYNLDNMIDQKNETSDALMARSALVEGDATAVMLDYSRGLMGQKKLEKETSVASLMMQNLLGAMLGSSMQQAPSSLQAILVFPYVSGLNFAHTLLRKGSYKAIDRAFKNLPVSTEQILHPEKYLANKRDFIDLEDRLPPKKVKLKSLKPIFSDTLGEFVISTLLGTWISTARASTAAAGWGGDRISLYEHASSKHTPLVWITNWDSQQDRIEFFDAIVDAYTKRFTTAPSIKTETKAAFNSTEFGNIEISVEDNKVLVNIGI